MMKTIIFERYGPPEVLQLKEVEKPVPGDNQVLVKIHAASANPLDWHRMRADPFLARLSEGFWRPKTPKLGADIAGVVEAVGKDVTEFKPGDAVFGSIGAGGFAEYALAREVRLAHKPTNISFEGAASTPVVGFTAIQGMRDFGKIQPGEKVLINGASGGIGTFAVQYAKAVGAEVTGVTSTRNLELVRSIGADNVIDYTQTDFSRTGQQYDLIFDTIGNISISSAKRALNPQGRCVVAGFTTMRQLLALAFFGNLKSEKPGPRVGMMGTAQDKKEDLLVIQELLESGKIKPVIDRRYPLHETAQAIAYLETGRARGKVIVSIADGTSN
jgi:NADPH:quinone reductase-like Zn-dependent oxidoreductase